MKRIYISFLFVCLWFNANAQSKGDGIIGDWITTDRNAIIRCYKQGNLYYCKLLWYEPFHEEEEGHPIDPVENTKYLNQLVMKNFTFNDNEWSGGQIIDLKKNHVYTSFVKINEKKQLEVTGYVLFRWLSQTLTLNKMSPNLAETFIKNYNKTVNK